jgi:hypothetical protein
MELGSLLVGIDFSELEALLVTIEQVELVNAVGFTEQAPVSAFESMELGLLVGGIGVRELEASFAIIELVELDFIELEKLVSASEQMELGSLLGGLETLFGMFELVEIVTEVG